jgi:hypothetical protein
MFNRLLILGRQSERGYVRVYPNPGFMVPLPSGRRLVWSWHKGLIVRSAGSRQQPPAWVAQQHKSRG